LFSLVMNLKRFNSHELDSFFWRAATRCRFQKRRQGAAIQKRISSHIGSQTRINEPEYDYYSLFTIHFSLFTFLYCSKTMPNSSSTDPHCCPEGYWYDETKGGCTNYASCYSGGKCIYEYNSYEWWHTDACIPNSDENKACCPADMIGNPFGDASQGAYHYWPIESY